MRPSKPIQVLYPREAPELRSFHGIAISQFNILEDQLSQMGVSQGTRSIRRGHTVIQCKKIGDIRQVNVFYDSQKELAIQKPDDILDKIKDPLPWNVVVEGVRTVTATDDTQLASFTLNIKSHNSHALITAVSASPAEPYTDINGDPVSILGEGNPLVITKLRAIAGEPPEAGVYKVFILGYAWDTTGKYAASFSGIYITLTVNPYSSVQPVAKTGPDQIIQAPFDNDGTEGVWVEVDGSASYDPDGTVTDWEWSWDDMYGHHIVPGETASLNITGFGTHQVTLTVTDDSSRQGSVITIIKIVDSNKAPIASASSPGQVMCAQNETSASFTLDGSATTDPNDGDTLTYEWKEGTTIVATGIKPIITTQIGLHTYILKVTDLRGLSSTDTTSTEVLKYSVPPVANAGSDVSAVIKSSPSGTYTTTLDGSASYDPDGTIVAYNWYFKGQSIGQTVTLSVNAPVGTNLYTLYVTDNTGLVSSDTVTVDIQFIPDWILIVPSSETTLTAQDYTQVVNFSLTGMSLSPYNYIVSTTWFDAGNTVIGTGVTLNISLTAVGGDSPSSVSQALKCQATDNYGTTLTYSFTITANPYISTPPHAVITPVQASIFLIPPEGIRIILDGSNSYSADDPIVQYDWYWFYDGANEYISATNYDVHATGPNPVLVAYTYGPKEVLLIVTNKAGVTGGSDAGPGATLTDSNEAPVVEFGVSSINPTATSAHTAAITCTNLTTDVNTQYGDSLTYAWSLDGGGTISTAVNPVITVPEGSHRITLVATDLRGLTGTNYMDITVAVYVPPNTKPVANAGANQSKNYTTSGAYPTFYLNGSSSYDPDGDSITYNWYHGNTLLSHAAAFNWKPGGPGTYTVSLQVVDSHGAVDWDTCVLTVTFSAYWAYTTRTRYYNTIDNAVDYGNADYTEYASVMVSTGIAFQVQTPNAAPSGYSYVSSDIKVPIGTSIEGTSQLYDNPGYDVYVYGVPGERFPAEHGQPYSIAYFNKKIRYIYYDWIHGVYQNWGYTSYNYVLHIVTSGTNIAYIDRTQTTDPSEVNHWYTGLDMRGEHWFTLIYAIYVSYGFASIEMTELTNETNALQTYIHVSHFRRYITS